MGKGYKTVSAAPMDYMYKLPQELMANVLQTKEKMNDMVLESGDVIDNSILGVDFLPQQKDYFDKKKLELNNRTKELADKVWSDPVNGGKYQAEMKKIAKELQEEMTLGGLGILKNNSAGLKAHRAEHQKRIDKGSLRQEDYDAIVANELKNASYLDENGKPLKINLSNVTDSYDIPKYMLKYLEELKASGEYGSAEQISKDLTQKLTQARGWEGLTEDKVFGTLAKSILADIPFMNSLRQRQNSGVAGYENTFHKDGRLNMGEFVTKQVVTKDPVTGLEKTEDVPEWVYANNVLARGMQSAISAKTYMKTKNSSSQNETPYGASVRQDYFDEKRSNRDLSNDLYKYEAKKQIDDRYDNDLTNPNSPASKAKAKSEAEALDKMITSLEKGDDNQKAQAYRMRESLAAGASIESVLELMPTTDKVDQVISDYPDLYDESQKFGNQPGSGVRTDLSENKSVTVQQKIQKEILDDVKSKYGVASEEYGYFKWLNGAAPNDDRASQYLAEKQEHDQNQNRLREGDGVRSSNPTLSERARVDYRNPITDNKPFTATYDPKDEKRNNKRLQLKSNEEETTWGDYVTNTIIPGSLGVKNYILDQFQGTRYGPTSMQASSGNASLQKLKNFGDDVAESQTEKVITERTRQTETAFNPVTQSTGHTMANYINSNKGLFNMINQDQSGTVDVPGNVKSVRSVGGGNSGGPLILEAIVDIEGKDARVQIFPANNASSVGALKYMTLQGLPNKNSKFYREMLEDVYNETKTILSSGQTFANYEVGDINLGEGIMTRANLFGDKTETYFTDKDGKISVIDPYSSNIIEYDDYEHMIETNIELKNTKK